MATDADLEAGPIVLEPGAVIADRYRVVEVIGQGGMGVVYKAQQIHMDKPVALKMMLQQHSAASQDYRRFQREAQAASLLDHPNIVSIHDFGYAEKQAYLCMDYLTGQSLDVVLNRAPLTLDLFRHVFAQACDALQHAHDRGIVHRDLKPSNLMITERRDDPYFVMVLDFGLVKMMDSGESSGEHKLTMTNMVLGSPLYMSPEQCRAAALDHRSDIYSLGCVMYEALTGMPPLRAETLFDIMSKHISENPISLRDALPGLYVPSALERVIFKAMAKNPDDRYQSMKDLAKAIEQSFSGAPDLVLPRKTAAVGSSSGAVTGAASAGTLAKVKRKNNKENTVVAISIGFGVVMLCMIPLGIIYNNTKSHSSRGTHDSKSTDSPAPDLPGSGIETKSGDGQGQANSSSSNSPYGISPGKTIFLGQGNQKTMPKQPFPSANTGPNTGAAGTLASTTGPSSGLTTPALASPAAASQPAASANMPQMSFTNNSMPQSMSRSQIAQQLQADADLAFRQGQYSQASQKYSELLSMGAVSSDAQTKIAAKMTICAYQAKNASDMQTQFSRFKDLYNYNSRSLDGDYQMMLSMASIARQVSDTPDYRFMEKILGSAIEAYERANPGPSPTLIRMKLELNRVYMDQGKLTDAERLLQGCLSDAANFPAELQSVKALLEQLRPPAPPANVSGFQPGMGPGMGGPGMGGPGMGGPQMGGPQGGGFPGGPPPFGPGMGGPGGLGGPGGQPGGDFQR